MMYDNLESREFLSMTVSDPQKTRRSLLALPSSSL